MQLDLVLARDLLVSAGIDLRLGHATYIKAISYATVKTDAVDAATLPQLLRSDLIPEAHMVGAEWRDARDLLRARLQLAGQQVRCKHTLAGLFAQYHVPSPAARPRSSSSGRRCSPSSSPSSERRPRGCRG